jgi:hypothetical protein
LHIVQYWPGVITQKRIFRIFGEGTRAKRAQAAPAKLAGMVSKYDVGRVSWEAEVIFRFAHEPVAVAVSR